MANKRTDMTTIRQLIRLKSEGKSHKYISHHLGISRTTVVGYVKQLRQTGIAWSSLREMNDESLKILLQPATSSNNNRHQRLLAFFPYMEKELKKPGVTRQLLWEEYKQDEPDAYRYSQFCYHYRLWTKPQLLSAPLQHGFPPILGQ